MAEILEITQVGDSVLRQKAQSIEVVKNPNWQNLIDNLIITAKSANGVGIAAPQVNQSYRLFIVASRPSPRYPHAPVMEPTAMINPKILGHSTEKVKDWEGCLSVPGYRGLVPRYSEIEVAYHDRFGTLHQEISRGFVARIFQHELDHLDGLLWLDRLENQSDRITEEEYQELIKCNGKG